MKCYFCGKDASAKIGRFTSVLAGSMVFCEIYVCDKHLHKTLTNRVKNVFAEYKLEEEERHKDVNEAIVAQEAERKRIADDEKTRLANIETLKREVEVAKKKEELKTKVRKGIKKTAKKRPAFKYVSKARK